MNNADKAAALAWALHMAEQGALPRHIDIKGREFVVALISAAITHLSDAQTPKELAVITHTVVEGEYDATH